MNRTQVSMCVDYKHVKGMVIAIDVMYTDFNDLSNKIVEAIKNLEEGLIQHNEEIIKYNERQVSESNDKMAQNKRIELQ